MKLKRPSGANEYDSITDIDGEGHVSTETYCEKAYAPLTAY